MNIDWGHIFTDGGTAQVLGHQTHIACGIGSARLMINLVCNQHILRKQQRYRQQDGVLSPGRMPGTANQKGA